MLLEDGKDVFFESHLIVCLDGELAAVRAVAKRKRAEHVFWMLLLEELIDAMTVGISFPADAEGQIARNPVFGIWQQIAILFDGRFFRFGNAAAFFSENQQIGNNRCASPFKCRCREPDGRDEVCAICKRTTKLVTLLIHRVT